VVGDSVSVDNHNNSNYAEENAVPSSRFSAVVAATTNLVLNIVTFQLGGYRFYVIPIRRNVSHAVRHLDGVFEYLMYNKSSGVVIA